MWQDWQEALGGGEVEDCRWTPVLRLRRLPVDGHRDPGRPDRPAAAAAHPRLMAKRRTPKFRQTVPMCPFGTLETGTSGPFDETGWRGGEPAAGGATAAAGGAEAADPLREAWPAALHQPPRLRPGLRARDPPLGPPDRLQRGLQPASEGLLRRCGADRYGVGGGVPRDRACRARATRTRCRRALDEALPLGIDILEVIDAATSESKTLAELDRGLAVADRAPGRGPSTRPRRRSTRCLPPTTAPVERPTKDGTRTVDVRARPADAHRSHPARRTTPNASGEVCDTERGRSALDTRCSTRRHLDGVANDRRTVDARHPRGDAAGARADRRDVAGGREATDRPVGLASRRVEHRLGLRCRRRSCGVSQPACAAETPNRLPPWRHPSATYGDTPRSRAGRLTGAPGGGRGEHVLDDEPTSTTTRPTTPTPTPHRARPAAAGAATSAAVAARPAGRPARPPRQRPVRRARRRPRLLRRRPLQPAEPSTDGDAPAPRQAHPQEGGSGSATSARDRRQPLRTRLPSTTPARRRRDRGSAVHDGRRRLPTSRSPRRVFRAPVVLFQPPPAEPAPPRKRTAGGCRRRPTMPPMTASPPADSTARTPAASGDDETGGPAYRQPPASRPPWPRWQRRRRRWRRQLPMATETATTLESATTPTANAGRPTRPRRRRRYGDDDGDGTGTRHATPAPSPSVER